MRLAEFLVLLLEAHAETLRQLAALLGEDNLVALLEMAGDSEEPARRPGPPQDHELFGELDPTIFEKPSAASGPDPYQEIEGAVHGFQLPATLEFHLWAYPPYRWFIESPVGLDARIPGPGGDAGALLVERTVALAEGWVRGLPIRSPLSLQ